MFLLFSTSIPVLCVSVTGKPREQEDRELLCYIMCKPLYILPFGKEKCPSALAQMS